MNGKKLWIPTPLLWQILNNDPVQDDRQVDQEMRRIAKLKSTLKAIREVDAAKGFFKNRQVEESYLFNEKALGSFLRTNKFSLMIRSNDVIQEGHKSHFNGKLMTVCSTSSFEDTEPAYIEINHRFLKPCRLNEVKTVKMVIPSPSTAVSSKESMNCPVCTISFDDLKTQSITLSSTKCGHVFCKRCLKDSLAVNRVCPTCRVSTPKNGFHNLYL